MREHGLFDQLPAVGMPGCGGGLQCLAPDRGFLAGQSQQARPCAPPSAGPPPAPPPPRRPRRRLTSPPAGSAWNPGSRRWLRRRRLTDKGASQAIGFAAAGQVRAVNRAAGAEPLRQLQEHPPGAGAAVQADERGQFVEAAARRGWRYERGAGRGGTRSRRGAGAVGRYSWSATLTQRRLQEVSRMSRRSLGGFDRTEKRLRISQLA